MEKILGILKNSSHIGILILATLLVLILIVYLFPLKGTSLKVIIPICSLILGLGICAVVAGYNNSKGKEFGKEFATFYEEVIKIKSDNTSDATNNQDNSNDVTLTDNHIKVLKMYADLLKEK